MAVHLGHDDRTEVRTLLKRTTLSLCSLSYTGIQHEHRLVGLDRLANLHHLLEQLRLLLMPPRGIDDDDLEPFLLKFRHTLAGDGDGIRLSVRAEVGYFGFGCGLSGLVEGTSTEGVGADDA
jgi:hypothetical protein